MRDKAGTRCLRLLLMNVLSAEHIWSILQNAHSERNIYQHELVIQYLSRCKLFELLCKQENPLAKKLELSKIVDKHLPHFKAVNFAPGDMVYFKEPKLREIYIIIKGTIGIYKEGVEKAQLKKGLTRSNTKLGAILGNTLDSTKPTQNTDRSKSKGSIEDVPSSEFIQNDSPLKQLKSTKPLTHIVKPSLLQHTTSSIRSRTDLLIKSEFGEPGLGFIDKLALVKRLKDDEYFGALEGGRFAEEIVVSETETWAVTLDIEQHRQIIEDIKADFIRTCNLLQSILIRSFQYDEVQFLTPYFKETCAHLEEVLYSEGDPAKTSYILVHGSVILTKKVDNGLIYKSKMMYKKLKAGVVKELVVDKIIPGTSFAEEMIFENKYRKVAAVSKSDYTIMLKLTEEAWNELKYYRAEIAKKFVDSIRANEFWRQQRLNVHLKEINSIKMRLMELGPDIKRESLPCVDVLLLDPRSPPPLFGTNRESSPKDDKKKAMNLPYYLTLPDKKPLPHNPGYMLPKGARSVRHVLPPIDLKKTEEDDLMITKLPEEVVRKLVNMMTRPNKRQRFFSFKPTSTDYFQMNEEEKENLFHISKDYEKFDPNSITARKNSDRNPYPPDKEDPLLIRRGLTTRGKQSKNDRNEYPATARDRVVTIEEEMQEAEKKKLPPVHKEEENKTYVSKLEEISSSLEGVWASIDATITQFSKRGHKD